MRTQVNKTLRNLMANFGPDIFKNPQQFKGAILDEHIDKYAKKIRFLLCLAIVDMKVFTRLLNVNISSLVEEMHTEYEINKQAAKVIVQCIASLHNLNDIDENDDNEDNNEKEIEENKKEDLAKLPNVVANNINVEVQKPTIIIQDEKPKEDLKTKIVPPQQQDKEQKQKKEPPQPIIITRKSKVGDIIHFGEHKWRVLKINDNGTALIITQEIVSKMAYHNRKIGITWERSDIRRYLNTTFLSKFTDSQQQLISVTEISNKFNEKHLTPGGHPTFDKIFLISIDEAQKLFANNIERTARQGNENSWWWLRSPGIHEDHAAFVYSGGSISLDGEVSVYTYLGQTGIRFVGYRVGGVRPAMVVNLSGIF